MTRNLLQEYAETLLIALLNNGMLRGGVFRHGDAKGRAMPEAITVQAAQPIPQLEGPGGFRVDVTIQIRSPKSGRNAAIHGECMSRITDAASWRSAAFTAGMTEDDDLNILTEAISGDRDDGRQLRKRAIIVPILIKKN